MIEIIFNIITCDYIWNYIGITFNRIFYNFITVYYMLFTVCTKHRYVIKCHILNLI